MTFAAMAEESRLGDSRPPLTEEKDGRGRSAGVPSEIPPRGWKDILLRVFANLSSHRILSFAAGMTFYSLLAIFPALAALVAVYGLFADPSSIAGHLDQVAGFLPGGAIEVAKEQLTRIASKGAQTLGLTFLVGLCVSLWSANAAMKSLFDTLNIVYGEEEKRGFVKLNVMSLLFTVGGSCSFRPLSHRSSSCPRHAQLRRAIRCGGSASTHRKVAGHVLCSDPRFGVHLPIWAEPRSSAMAMDFLGQRHGRSPVARPLSPVLAWRFRDR